MHNGTDFKASLKTSFTSPVSGEVTLNDSNAKNGNRLQVTDEYGIKHDFLHLNERPDLKPDKDTNITTVKKGQTIARTGNTGSSTGPHLHYQVSGKNGPIPPKQEDIDYLDDHFSSKLDKNDLICGK